jgi:hypothetical protein
MDNITASSLNELRASATAAREAYTKAHAGHEAAQALLGAAAGVRLQLIQAYEARKRLLADLKRAAVQAAIEASDAFPMACACAVASASEAALLSQGIRKFTAFEYADAEIATRAAQLAMLELQYNAEQLRLDLHQAALYQTFAEVVRQDPGTKIEESGGATRGLKELLLRVGRDREAARLALKAAEIEAQQLRDRYELEESK